MKKLVLMLAVAALAASPTLAANKHKKSKEPTEAEKIAQQNEYTKRVLVDSLPVVLPTWSLPLYFSMQQNEQKTEKKKK